MVIKVIGSGLDALLFAFYLTKSKKPYEWYSGDSRLGGFFRGSTDCLGRPIDIGMVLLEPNDFGVAQKKIEEFNGEFGQNARPFIKAAYEWLDGLGEPTRKVGVFAEDTEGVQHFDYFISDRMNAFDNSRSDLILELEKRIDWLKRNPEWHPKKKLNTDSILSTKDLVTVYENLYGQNFYNTYFKGYLENLLGDFAKKLPASHHRKAWMPLFWPETILDGVNQKSTESLYEPAFKRFSSKSIAQWVEAMLGEIENDRTAVKNTGSKFRILDGSDKTDHQVYAFIGDYEFDQVEKVSKVALSVQTARIRMVHFCCQSKLSNVVFLLDDTSGGFRYSITYFEDMEEGSITIEFGESTASLSNDKILVLATEFCRTRGIPLICGGKIHEGKLPIAPPPEKKANRESSLFGYKQLLHSKNTMSFNDNLVRAYWAINHARKEW